MKNEILLAIGITIIIIGIFFKELETEKYNFENNVLKHEIQMHKIQHLKDEVSILRAENVIEYQKILIEIYKNEKK